MRVTLQKKPKLKLWSLDAAIEFARQVERVCKHHKSHVALTGGCLYKGGNRKDLDLVIYSDTENGNMEYFNLQCALQQTFKFNWGVRGTRVLKAHLKDGRIVDFIFPENEGEYDGHGNEEEIDEDGEYDPFGDE
jgi:hypothetical protein